MHLRIYKIASSCKYSGSRIIVFTNFWPFLAMMKKIQKSGLMTLTTLIFNRILEVVNVRVSAKVSQTISAAVHKIIVLAAKKTTVLKTILPSLPRAVIIILRTRQNTN